MKYLKFGNSKNFIVFLHGWGADSRSFVWLKDYFDNFSLIFVDFAGFGASPEPDYPYSVGDYAIELGNLLGSFEIENLVLVGHSFGGRVAIKFAFLFQNEYQNLKLCLVDSAGIRPRKSLVKFLKIRRFKRLKAKAKKHPELKAKLDKMGSSDYKVLSDVMKQTFVKVVNEDLSSEAKYIRCKTCIVWGDRDKETKLYMAKKLNKLIKNSSLHVILGAGHFSFIENKQEFLILLDTFVKN